MFFRFMVNRRIFVVGFGLYGSIHGPTEYAVNIQVCYTLISFSLYNLYSKKVLTTKCLKQLSYKKSMLGQGHIKINVCTL